MCIIAQSRMRLVMKAHAKNLLVKDSRDTVTCIALQESARILGKNMGNLVDMILSERERERETYLRR